MKFPPFVEDLAPDSRTGMCPHHGEWQGVSCHQCTWAKIRSEQAEDAKVIGIEAARRREELARKTIWIPRRFAKSTISNFEAATDDQAAVLAACESYAGNLRETVETGRSMVLCGRPGTGKTHLVTGILKSAHRAGFTARYAVIEQIADSVKAGFSSGKSEQDAIRQLVDCDVLGIDEIGQTGSVFVFELFAKIVFQRHQDCRPTVVASNLTPCELETAVGQRVAERLSEGGGMIISMSWGSRRK